MPPLPSCSTSGMPPLLANLHSISCHVGTRRLCGGAGTGVSCVGDLPGSPLLLYSCPHFVPSQHAAQFCWVHCAAFQYRPSFEPPAVQHNQLPSLLFRSAHGERGAWGTPSGHRAKQPAPQLNTRWSAMRCSCHCHQTSPPPLQAAPPGACTQFGGPNNVVAYGDASSPLRVLEYFGLEGIDKVRGSRDGRSKAPDPCTTKWAALGAGHI